METITYSPLNLFTNFQEAAAGFSETPIICDQPLSAFPELGLETTYKKCFESVLDRAYQLAHLGVKSGDKVIIYKSSAFDTYLLAVSVSYWCSACHDFLSSTNSDNGSIYRPFRRPLHFI